MSRFREIKRTMRRDVHQEMSVPALYLPAPNAPGIDCAVRVHRRSDMPNFNDEAVMAFTEDRIRFLRSELPTVLRQNSIVSVEAGEAYRVEFWYPKDDQYITARVVPMTEAEAAGLPVPSSV